MLHLLRVGAMGLVGRFTAHDGLRYPRGRQVVARTARGLELATVLTPPDADVADFGETDGSIVRSATVGDLLLAERLARRRHEAYDACCQLLRERGVAATLIDVEHLLDGERVVFYFLGEVPPEVAELTTELAATYDTAVEFRKFSDTLLAGCGPGCGTEAAKGQGGCATCVSCAVAGACGPNAR